MPSTSPEKTNPISLILLFVAFLPGVCAYAAGPLYFDITDTDPAADKGEIVQPWKTIDVDAEYGGRWVIAGDIDGDRQVEIVSAENRNVGDVHYTSAVVAQELDGSVIWKWGDPAIGRKEWHHDVACQIYDLSGDNRNEVIVCDKGAVIELDGRTGKEIRRIKIAADATDCIVFCNLVGSGKPAGAGKSRDILVKDRYHNIYAYNRWGNLLWHVKDPGGSRTAHQPVAMDLDLDGHDEVMAGYAMLDHHGKVLWTYQSQKVNADRGHLDCVRVLRRGEKPSEFRLVLTCCGANNIAMIDGTGKVLWEIAGRHFESIDIGRVFADHPGPQILVDIDHQPLNQSPMWVLDEKGTLLAQVVTPYSRHHALLDWTGDGIDEILVAYSGAVYDHKGKRIATLDAPAEPGMVTPVEQRSLLIGDIDGDGVRDVIMATNTRVYIYRNAKGKHTGPKPPLGTGANLTLY